MAMGREVRLVACGTKETAVHPYWDDHVRSGENVGIYRSTQKASFVVHFECHELWFSKTSLATSKGRTMAKHILVPNWHSIFKHSRATVDKFHTVVCPTKMCKKVLFEDVFQGDKTAAREKLTWIRWDAGIPAVRREGTVQDGRIRACVFCDTSSIDFCGPMVIQLVNELLMMHPKLDITLVSLKSWCRRDRSDLKQMMVHWPKRFKLHRAASVCDMNKEYHGHDWAILPGVRGDFGLSASRALSCGAAVICNDVEPFSEIVGTHNGILVPCEIRHGASKAPIAVPHLGKWLEACNRAFTDTKLLFNLQTKDWLLGEQQAAFNVAWAKILTD